MFVPSYIKFEKMEKTIFKSKNTLINFLSLIFLSLTLLVSCKNDDEEEDLIGNWVKMSDFEGVPRADAVAFTIGSKAYVGTGFDGSDRLNDFWEYNPEMDYWQQKSNLPDTARNGAIGFGTNSKGYIGLGYDGYVKLKGFYEYDPGTNTWSRKKDFKGTARYGAVSFCINNIGYVGTGYDGNTLKDFWKYEPNSDTWTPIVSIGGSKRRDAVAFVVDGIGYVVSGVNNGTYVTDFWAYNPVTETWAEKRQIADVTDDSYDDDYNFKGIYGVGFNIGSKGYLACSGQSTVSSTVWEYDPLSDLWEEKYSLEGTARMEAVAFTVNNKGYVTTGRNASYYFDDIWEFHPDEDYNEYD
jgi:N-acetylneuraminic acid mutarotase